MVLYGHYRGALKQCVSLGALILTIILVKIATPYMTGFIKDNPSIRQSAAEAILNAAGWEEPSAESTELPAAQRIAIENLNLPQSVKETLLENNNSEFYHMLGWTSLQEYVSTYLADILINAVSSIILFAAVYILIHLLVRWLDLIARLPILYVCLQAGIGRNDDFLYIRLEPLHHLQLYIPGPIPSIREMAPCST